MMLWARQGRVATLGVVLALLVAGLVGLGGRSFALPAIFGTGGYVLWSTFLPLLWAVAVADCFAAKTQAVEARPARHVALLDLSLNAGATALACVAFVALGSGAEPPAAAVAHVLIMSGLAGATTLLAGPGPAVLAASALVVITTPYGRSGLGAGFVRILQPDGHLAWSLFVGGALSALACVLLATARTRVRLGRTDGP
jgi:hypothetical protein